MRWAELDAGGNFRDVGGYPAGDGLRTKWGVLYRSGSLDALSDRDVDYVRGLGIRSIIDLRTEDERLSALPWNHDDAIEVVALPSPNPAGASLGLGAYDPGALYIAAIEDRAQHLPVILSFLAEPDHLPAVVACSGGKDRTGMVIALILGVLGVPKQTIVEDYVLSDEFITRYPAAYAAALERVNDAGLDPEVLRTRPDTMLQFIREVEVRHGSISAFAAESGISEDVIVRIRETLLEPLASDGLG